MKISLFQSPRTYFIILSFAIGAASFPAHSNESKSIDSNSYSDTWNTVYQPFKDEGPLVEGADIVGGNLFGSIGLIVGIPLGFIGAAITQLTHDDPSKGYDSVLQTSSDSFSVAGKYLFGLPVYTVKKITYDLPLALIETDITYNQRTKKDGFSKIRH
ncbi:hypothetical protein A9Q81_27885 [Gammaproteobacteria bacterium 42_54_T18]|nr:hypothetical protein A9Q81_27885 [Gammaproteobacteria bacterium 42_54_T18]